VTLRRAGAARLEGWRVRDVGHLHGAIAGIDLSGLIGATYRAFPFPSRPEDFRQHPDGEKNEPEVRRLLDRFGVPEEISVRREPDGAVHIAERSFSREGFSALVGYVVRGGMPRWRDDGPPDYVTTMLEALGEQTGEGA